MPASNRFSSQPRVLLPGSEREPFSAENNPRLSFATVEPLPTPLLPEHAHATVSVLLRRKAPVDPGTRLTHEEFEHRHGADPASVELVKAFAAEFGLTVESTHLARRTMQLTGSAQALEQAFGVKLEHRETPGGPLRLRQGGIMLPEELAGHVEAVLGLDTRPQAKPHFRVAKPRAGSTSYSPTQVATLYGFPTNDAGGQTIGLIELGGGYRADDITAYFSDLGLRAPVVSAVSVDKGKNKPGNANGADGEVMLDIEVSAAVAQNAAIAVYFAPNTDQGFIDAVTTAVHDTQHKPGVVSISWGGPESSWTAQATTALDEACQAAASLGVTITVAAGDDGSSDGATDGGNHVDFPASSPNVLACGGTKLIGSGTDIASEVVWNEQSSNEGATGGGVSTVFAKPSWQDSAKVPAPTGTSGGRGVPDVAGDADPVTGYTVRVDGQTTVIGGTSAVAPLWAGLIALANAANGTNAGFVNATLYAAKGAFRDITSGNNGAYSAGPGWDACTGLGSPAGTGVVAALK